MASVRLTPISVNDLDDLMTWVNDTEVVGRFAGFQRTHTREDEAEYLEQVMRSDTDKVYTIRTKTGAYLGSAGVHEIDRQNGEGRLALIIGNKSEWGKGYGTAALHELLGKAFEELGLQHVYAEPRIDNTCMQHMCRRAGMETEGTVPYKVNDTQYIMLRMGVMAGAYKALEAAA